MRIQFCGADRTVTGSCHLLFINGKRIFLDMGLFQGPRDEANRFNRWLADDATSADAVILSHGHLDHCGKLPLLASRGYKGPIYCTPATAAVAKIVMNDSAHIQQENADFLNQRSRAPGEAPARPLYSMSDANAAANLFRTIPLGQRTDLGNDISFTFYEAGHILGSAYVVVDFVENGAKKSLLFTADIGRYNTPILRDPQPPPAVDWVITESTYGNTVHGPMEQVGADLLAMVQSCISNRSRLLVPAFAVGRTQTILWYIQKFIHDKQIQPLPIYIDSPMAVEISRIDSNFRDAYDDQTREMIGQSDLFGLSRVTFASTVDQSKKINADPGPCVIIASSPTCEFGRILHHLAHSVEKPKDMVVFVGYTPPNTLGRRLADGEKRVKILDQWFDVKCQVKTLHGQSAHADGDELVRFLSPTINPKTRYYIVHGEVPSAQGLAQRLTTAGAKAIEIPAFETEINL